MALAAGCLILANCSGNFSRIDPRYGVASSERVVPLGVRAPKGGGVYRVGKPYVVAGRTYVPRVDNHYSAVGMASWYGDDFHGRYTANGEIFDEKSITAASPVLPLPSYVRVTNLENHRSIVVRVNDRGPYVGNRLIDVSVRTAKLLGFYDRGLTKVKVEYVGRAPLSGSSDRELLATLRKHGPASGVQLASAVPFYFNAKPIAQHLPRQAPLPPDRPYGVEEATATPLRQDARQDTLRVPSMNTAAANQTAPRVSMVSAFAPERYDGHASYLNGRGLY